MCKRDTHDPLVRLFLDRYHLNLLPTPRQRTDCGDLYVEDRRGVSPPIAISTLFAGGLQLPAVDRDERLGALEGVLSETRDTGIGLSLLDGLLTAIGALGVIASLQTSYERAGTLGLRFEFRDATRDTIDPGALGHALLDRRLIEDHPIVRGAKRYYVVTGVVRTPSVTVHRTRAASAGAGVDIDVAGVAGAHTSFRVEQSGEDTHTYSGPRPLAIGVELYELIRDEKANGFRLQTPKGPLNLRGALPAEPQPAFIGADEDVFIPAPA